MDMAAILINGAEPFEQIGNTLTTEGPMWNLVKLLKRFQRRRHLNNQTESPIFVILCVLCFQRQSFFTFILYMYIV